MYLSPQVQGYRLSATTTTLTSRQWCCRYRRHPMILASRRGDLLDANDRGIEASEGKVGSLVAGAAAVFRTSTNAT